MNTINIQRLFHDDRPTIGVVKYNDSTLCFSLEDRYREGDKVAGDTRIPAGTYDLQWRKVGTWAARFRKMGFPGSLQIMDVPGFDTILIHIGNDHEDTAGCPLVGMGALIWDRTITNSKIACKALYNLVDGQDGDWSINIKD